MIIRHANEEHCDKQVIFFFNQLKAKCAHNTSVIPVKRVDFRRNPD